MVVLTASIAISRASVDVSGNKKAEFLFNSKGSGHTGFVVEDCTAEGEESEDCEKLSQFHII